MMGQFDDSFEHMKAFFPNQPPQEIQRYWTFIKHQDGSFNTEEVRKPEQVIREKGPTELELAHFEAVLTLNSGENWWKSKDWDE
jgi:hypothetical protein